MPQSIDYPPTSFAFAVTLGGAQAGIDAAFQEVSGIDPKVEVTEIAEGGTNGFVYQVPGATKHSNLVLKRGYVTRTSALAQWAAANIGSDLGTPVTTKIVNVSLLGSDAQPLVTWAFANAWPVKWQLSGFDSAKNEVLTETIEIAYTSVVRTFVRPAGT